MSIVKQQKKNWFDCKRLMRIPAGQIAGIFLSGFLPSLCLAGKTASRIRYQVRASLRVRLDVNQYLKWQASICKQHGEKTCCCQEIHSQRVTKSGGSLQIM